MSRIGKKPVAIPQGVEVRINGREVVVKGPKGTLSFKIPFEIEIVREEGVLILKKKRQTKQASALWGTSSRIVTNMLKGVSQGFSKQLELNGVGYRMGLQGKKLNLALGFSHPVEMAVPDDIEVKIDQNIITISGIDKQKVGQLAAELRSLKPVEPYKGKGFKYVGEIFRKKESKKAVVSA